MASKSWYSSKKSKPHRGFLKPLELDRTAGVGPDTATPSKQEDMAAPIVSGASSAAVHADGARAHPLTELSQATAATGLVDLRARVTNEATFFYAFQADAAPFRIFHRMTAAIKIDENGAPYLAIADGRADAGSGGETGGWSIRVPDEVEAAASGNRVIVTTIARATGGGQSKFALAYSTAEVGNSGWRWFTAGPEWSMHAMEYAVPPMIKGNGDFVGVLAEPEGKPGVEFCCVAVKVVPKATAE